MYGLDRNETWAYFFRDQKEKTQWTLAFLCRRVVPWRRLRTLPRWHSRVRRWVLASSPSLTTSYSRKPSGPRILAASADSITPRRESQGEYLEALALLSFLAGITSSAKLLTAVMVLPNRPPVLTAKTLATIDVLSKGRVIVGCGVGWMREEYDVLGSPPFDKRGAVCNEYIQAFRELWTQDNPTFEGTYCRFSDIEFAPKPVQKPYPPIWTGGESPGALRRAGRLADGWYPFTQDVSVPLVTPEQFAACAARVRQHAREAGRDPDSLDLAYGAGAYNDQEAQKLPDG